MHTDETLKQIHIVTLEILNVIDKLCRENDIRYSLCAGTLLGAVRHQGFIPWDDDLDVCMSREHYERFIEVWKKVQPCGYILQNKDNTPNFTRGFTKIRKDHTTFIQNDSEIARYHTGIFVDIFPMDRVPNGLARWAFYCDCCKYQLLTRQFVPCDSNIIIKCFCRLYLMCTSSNHIVHRKKLEKKLLKYTHDNRLRMAILETQRSMRTTFPSDIMEEFCELKFEGQFYMCFSNWYAFLENNYGDYMQLPPESERVWKHHPLIIDFEHNYEELNHTK